MQDFLPGPASFSSRTLAEIVRSFPSAAAVLRSHRIDFCCRGDLTLSEAARHSNLILPQIETELAAIAQPASRQMPTMTRDLIDHITERYHETHRRELPGLIDLALKIEAVHGGHQALPAGLSRLLQTMRLELEMHMCKEEHIVFALIKEGEGPLIGSTIEMMMLDHESHGAMLRQLETLTAGCMPPADACRSWHALYAGLRKLIDDLVDHIHLENNILFPRFLNRGLEAASR
ncbi:iron-sulfur cluster repair di-iron protein [Ferrovibrio sp.]|uniref:iron-sulfur cluster repair di-iron protein n=1 Tax=Ferrovibrio sp. TaxID=1917215 RepID=UPI0026220FA6|nr:iron-sulfur cluster repair di-iron protein [Ferrovibrio sp.]